MRTCTVKQWETIRSVLDREFIKANAKEVNKIPQDALYLFTYQASYGDWNYYVLGNGEFVCDYYSIGD